MLHNLNYVAELKVWHRTQCMLQNSGYAQGLMIIVMLQKSGYATELSVYCRTQGVAQNLVYAAELRVCPGFDDYYYAA